MYFANFQIVWTGKGSASGGIKISLPASPTSVNGGTQSFTASIGFFSGITYTNQIIMLGDSGSGAFLAIKDVNKAGGSPTDLTQTAFSTSGQIRGCVWFTT
jgi:hypothetical protein